MTAVEMRVCMYARPWLSQLSSAQLCRELWACLSGSCAAPAEMEIARTERASEAIKVVFSDLSHGCQAFAVMGSSRTEGRGKDLVQTREEPAHQRDSLSLSTHRTLPAKYPRGAG